MLVREMLVEIEMTLDQAGAEKPDRATLLKYMSADLNEITGLVEWDWAVIYLDPVIRTETGTASYTLPEDFPDQFIRYSGEDGDRYCCKLYDGSTETLLTYKSPAQFFGLSLSSATNSKPADYTLVSTSAGRRQIRFNPPPDANGDTGYYEIQGAYIPTDWKLADDRNLPPIPGNSAVLKYGVLRRFDSRTFTPLFQEAKAILMLRAAKARPSKISLWTGQATGTYDYSLMRGR